MSDNNYVYIPLCDISACKAKLQAIAKIVNKCTTQHEMYASFTHWFKMHFEDNHFTILHHCPDLWKKIGSFTQTLMKKERKLILLNLCFPDDVTPPHSDATTVTEFFENFGSARKVTNEEELKNFAFEVNDCVNKFLGEEIEPDEDIETETPGTSTEGAAADPVEIDNDWIEENPDPENFDKYPDIFALTEHQHIFVRCCYFNDLNTDLHIYPPGKNTTVEDLINTLNSKQSTEKMIKHIFFKTLPEMFSKGDLPSLSEVCACKFPIVQKRALTLLELAVWEVKDLDSLFTYLHNAEDKLFSILKNLSLGCNTSKMYAFVALQERAANVNLMILSAMFMTSKLNETAAYKCQSYLITIKERASRFMSSGVHKTSKGLNKVNKFVQGANDFWKVKKKIEGILNKLDGTTEKVCKCAKDISQEPLIVNVVVIFEVLRKVYQPQADEKSLIFLHQYVATPKRLFGTKGPEPICVVMIFRALTLFLKHRLYHYAHMNVQYLCQSMLDILQSASATELSDEVKRNLHSLLFHPSDLLRKKLLCFVDVCSHTLTQYMRIEVIRLLDPLLNVEEKAQTVKMVTSKCWKFFSCEFAGQQALLYLHINNVKDHKRHMKPLPETHEDVNFNEMIKLKQLQHKNIIQLLAFQRSRTPTFYILEDCSQDLQNVMQNCRNVGKYFSPLELYNFLLDAISALQYCHDKGFIHRNVTALSLAYIENKMIKLSSFGMSVELGNTQKVKDFSQQKNIPLRWSSPESLFKNEFNKQTDIWMVGILLYEVCSHGVLPFSNIRCSDLELGQKMQSKSLRLTCEACIDRSMAELIADCTNFEPDSRPYIGNVKTRLEDMIYESTQSARNTEQCPYPTFDNHERQPSTSHSRGVPLLLLGKSFEDKINDMSKRKALDMIIVSDMLIRIRKKYQLLFFERVPHKMSPSTTSLFHHEELKRIMPHLESMKIYPTEGFNLYLATAIPESKSLLSLAEDRQLSLQSILELILHIAITMSRIADLDLILGNLHPEAVYVDENNPKKTYIMSLAFMKEAEKNVYYDTPDHYQDQSVIPSSMVPRVAPEFIQERTASKETDVYCFGSFLWEVLSAFDVSIDTVYVNDRPTLFQSLSQDKILNAVLKNEWADYNPCPKCCPDKIYQLILLCVSSIKLERPKMDHVVKMLREYCNELFNVNLQEISLEGPPRDEWLFGAMSMQSLTVANPSTIDGESTITDWEFKSLFSQATGMSLQEENQSSIYEDPSIASEDNESCSSKLLVDYNVTLPTQQCNIIHSDSQRSVSDCYETAFNVPVLLDPVQKHASLLLSDENGNETTVLVAISLHDQETATVLVQVDGQERNMEVPLQQFHVSLVRESDVEMYGSAQQEETYVNFPIRSDESETSLNTLELSSEMEQMVRVNVSFDNPEKVAEFLTSSDDDITYYAKLSLSLGDIDGALKIPVILVDNKTYLNVCISSSNLQNYMKIPLLSVKIHTSYNDKEDDIYEDLDTAEHVQASPCKPPLPPKPHLRKPPVPPNSLPPKSPPNHPRRPLPPKP